MWMPSANARRHAVAAGILDSALSALPDKRCSPTSHYLPARALFDESARLSVTELIPCRVTEHVQPLRPSGMDVFAASCAISTTTLASVSCVDISGIV